MQKGFLAKDSFVFPRFCLADVIEFLNFAALERNALIALRCAKEATSE
jgi:hypothetical protein